MQNKNELLLKITDFQSFSVHVIKCTKTDDLFWIRFSIKKYGCRSRFSLFMDASNENRHFVWVTNLCTGSNRTNRIFLQSSCKRLLLERRALSSIRNFPPDQIKLVSIFSDFAFPRCDNFPIFKKLSEVFILSWKKSWNYTLIILIHFLESFVMQKSVRCWSPYNWY